MSTDEPSDKINNYSEIRKQTAELYSSFGKVRCPALGNEWVHFTSEGFNHLIYKTKKKPRDLRVQIMKFELLGKAKFIIEKSTTFQEYEEYFDYLKIEKFGRKVYENTTVRCWGLVAIVKRFRVKVVIRQIGNGKKEFYSVIPAWFTKQYRDIKIIETVTKSGLLAEDDDGVLKNTN
ncbi:MAG: hypothetical protein NTV48_00410 [Candidatus Vogelbacteria bacterium]|nr:hypothetical protein [Candidatus Vogelbacteria bacterium]